MGFLRKKCFSEEEKKIVHKSFYSFRFKRDSFDFSTAWIHADSLCDFWQSFLSIKQHAKLVYIAFIIYETPTNSIASEYAFSYIGLITNAIRNRIKAERATKLIYIYINQRVINKNSTLKDWQEGTEEELVELENLLLQIEEEEEVELDMEQDIELDELALIQEDIYKDVIENIPI